MELFWKTTAAVLIGLILILTLDRQERDMGTVLTIAVCCLAGAAAVQLLSPVLSFLEQLQDLAGMKDVLLRSLLQMTGVGLVTELAALICADAGRSSLGNCLHLLGSAGILYLSLPVFETLTDLIREILNL